MKLIIHAGIQRTGTTSLQSFLSKNRELLLNRGIAYPGSNVNHQSIAWGLKRGDLGSQDICNLIEQQRNADIVVLSAEDFCILTDLRWLEEIAKRYESYAFFYLRRQDHWLMSWYNQHVKWPFDAMKAQMGKTEFLNAIGDFEWIDYARLLERWAKILGDSHIKVNILEKGQVENVLESFVPFLGVGREGFNYEVENDNKALPVHLLEISRILNTKLFGLVKEGKRWRLNRIMMEALAQKAQPMKTIYSPSERLQILERFKKSNQLVAKRYFDRKKLFLEPFPSSDEPYYQFPNLSNEELLKDWIAPILHRLLSEL